LRILRFFAANYSFLYFIFLRILCLFAANYSFLYFIFLRILRFFAAIQNRFNDPIQIILRHHCPGRQTQPPIKQILADFSALPSSLEIVVSLADL